MVRPVRTWIMPGWQWLRGASRREDLSPRGRGSHSPSRCRWRNPEDCGKFCAWSQLGQGLERHKVVRLAARTKPGSGDPAAILSTAEAFAPGSALPRRLLHHGSQPTGGASNWPWRYPPQCQPLSRPGGSGDPAAIASAAEAFAPERASHHRRMSPACWMRGQELRNTGVQPLRLNSTRGTVARRVTPSLSSHSTASAWPSSMIASLSSLARAR